MRDPTIVRPVPLSPPLESDALRQWVATTRPWGRLRAPLANAVSRGLWCLLAMSLAVVAWLAAALAGAVPCSGPVCTIVTLGDRPMLQLALAGIGVVGLSGTAVPTRGLKRANGPELIVIIVAAIAGVLSLLGVVAVAVIGAVVIALAVTLLVVFVDRF